MNKFRYFLLLLIFALLFGSTQFLFAGIGIERTFVLQKNQVPVAFRSFNASQVYLLYDGSQSCYPKSSLRGDTITNFKMFMDSLRCGNIDYRLIFSRSGKVDSVWQTDNKFRITDKTYNLNNGFLRALVFDETGKQTDNFIFNYQKKYQSKGLAVPTLTVLMRSYEVYSYTDRIDYSAGAVWILSIGNDDYGDIKYKNCQSDASAYVDFFKQQFKDKVGIFYDSLYHSYLLTDKFATRDSILGALRAIAAKAAVNDIFIFIFSGQSYLYTQDSVEFNTYFFPHDVIIHNRGDLSNRNVEDKSSPMSNLISLKTLQEHIQLIPCTKQLFISEAGPSEKFKSEFVKTMMQHSPEIASLLNINRVIIVPNQMGYDDLQNLGMAPITYYITSLDSVYNIYDLFSEDQRADKIAYSLKSKEYKMPLPNGGDYFSVFFEKKFLQQYREIFGDEKNKKRGLDLGKEEIKTIKGFSANRYALVIGTDNYKAADWEKLENPVYDATEISEILKNYYDYEVKLLKDPPMDSIYQWVSNYYKNLKEDDQLIIYFAGHGDFDDGLLDDGFIVCSDSKSPEADPLRNTYIQHTKLKKMINKIPAKQILVLLDICHGGVFDANVLGRQRDNPASNVTNRNVLELLKDKSQYVTRKVLSSVGKEPAFDGKAGKHSPFASYLIKILNAKGGAEGVVTLSDIYALLQKASLNETATLKISPHIAGFGENDPMSEYILIPIKN